MTFKELNLSAPLLRAVQEAGYETPLAHSGSGHPAGAGRPGSDGLRPDRHRQDGGFCAAHAGPAHRQCAPPQGAVRALILTPTRELALQIGESFEAYGKYLKLRSTVIFGGVGQAPQVEALKKGVDILIACPGRLNDLIGQGFIDLSALEIFVLDEADRMLDMGFVHDVKKVIAKLPAQRQNLMFSATMPAEIEQLAAGILRDPAFVKVDPVSSTVDRIQQSLYYVEKGNKKLLLPWLIKNLQPPVVNALVFSRTKHGADKIAKDLTKQGIPAAAIHGNKSQTARVTALEDFKSGKTRVLVATDIAARGIDISELSHVFNYDLPEVPETYVHRIGRTARAGADGTAVSFCAPEEQEYLAGIEKQVLPYGVDKLHVFDAPGLFPYTSLPHSSVLINLFKEEKPQICLMGATVIGRDLGPRVSSALTSGLTADCTSLEIGNHEDKKEGKVYENLLYQIRPAFGGNIVATIVNPEHRPQMATVREGVMKKEIVSPAYQGEVIRHDVKKYVADTDYVVKVIERHVEKAKNNLKGSPIIIAGGYGVGSKENLRLAVQPGQRTSRRSRCKPRRCRRRFCRT